MFSQLLKKTGYDPSKDVLVHVGDVITKVPLKGSRDVLKFLSTHNITGVRGNHDQKVIEWRGWLDWISTLPGGTQWLRRLEEKWESIQKSDATVGLKSFIEEERCGSQATDKKWWQSIPKGWTLLGDHYHVAKGMSTKEYNYLLQLPLRLHVPHAHTFIVHAGLLPTDPRHPLDDARRQPLARVPTIPRKRTGGSSGVDELRTLQEIGLLTQVPQNLDAWTTLNMRGFADGKVTKDSSIGKDWTKIWKKQMKSCVGFGGAKGENATSDESAEFVVQARGKGKKKVYRLPCLPMTTIYGHTASRGLDVKRWTVGLDSGCVRDLFHHMRHSVTHTN